MIKQNHILYDNKKLLLCNTYPTTAYDPASGFFYRLDSTNQVTRKLLPDEDGFILVYLSSGTKTKRRPLPMRNSPCSLYLPSCRAEAGECEIMPVLNDPVNGNSIRHIRQQMSIFGLDLLDLLLHLALIAVATNSDRLTGGTPAPSHE